MEGILTTFGIDGRLIVIQIINFALMAGVLWYFLYTPVLNMLKEREDKIKKGVKDAEDAENALAEADAEKKVVLTSAHKEAEEVALRAKTHAEEKATLIAEEATKKADHLIQEAERKGEDIKERSRKESEAEIAKIAMLTAEKILREKSV